MMEMTLAEKLAMALERNAELEQENERAYGKISISSQHLHALEETMLHELGGQVEGGPTGRINYLQRIRELRAREAQAARYRAALEEVVASVDTECRWCGAHSWELCRYECPVAIAHRALHPEEGEG